MSLPWLPACTARERRGWYRQALEGLGGLEDSHVMQELALLAQQPEGLCGVPSPAREKLCPTLRPPLRGVHHFVDLPLRPPGLVPHLDKW